ncbi:hypothetical protein [Roseibium alexandrii]|uniref:Uncharacterized protein n=1 Tax=Roseibium alexandrii TaxID=388408 RepID=A0A0M7AQF0_9HYPH|nr:hypothetical protein [Roseibium alexandrii]CTQ77365.1 hypothetical protein LAX5112_04884 [Roseibium alexandrii]
MSQEKSAPWDDLTIRTKLFYLLVFGFLIITGYLLLQGENSAGWALGAAALCLLGTRWGDVKKFSINKDGASAELERLVTEANATIEELRGLAVATARNQLAQLSASGRYGGMGRDLKEDIRENILSTLRDLRVSDGDIEHVISVQYPFMHYDYCHRVQTLHGLQADRERDLAWTTFWTEQHSGRGNEPDPDTLEAFLDKHDLLDDAARERLEDYRHFHETQQHRRPDQIPF